MTFENTRCDGFAQCTIVIATWIAYNVCRIGGFKRLPCQALTRTLCSIRADAITITAHFTMRMPEIRWHRKRVDVIAFDVLQIFGIGGDVVAD